MSSPPENESKIDVAGRKGSPPDGVIRFELDEISKTTTKLSPEVLVKGAPWKLVVYRKDRTDKDRADSLFAVLDCLVDQSTPWTIDVEAEYTIVHPTIANGNLNFEKKQWQFTIDDTRHCVCLLDWAALCKGFVCDGKITVEIRFWITNMRGIRTVTRADFTNPDDPVHDVALVLEGEKIYVSKQLLALHSPVFKAMFYGDFAEKDQKEIDLKDVDRKEFVELLHVIYPSCKKITVHSAVYLLKLGDRFQVKYVMDKVEDFLIGLDLLAITEKLRFADQYRLVGLQEHVFSELTTKEHFKKIQESSIYGNLSDTTKAALFEKVMQIDE